MGRWVVAGLAGMGVGGALYFLARAQIASSLRREADRYAPIAAQQAAERHLGAYYGLTPARIQALGQLGRSLGVGA